MPDALPNTDPLDPWLRSDNASRPAACRRLVRPRLDAKALGTIRSAFRRNPAPGGFRLHDTIKRNRTDLVRYLAKRDLLGDGPFWKLTQALFEIVPRDLEDWKLVNALLGERQTLRAEGKGTAYTDVQASFDFPEEP